MDLLAEPVMFPAPLNCKTQDRRAHLWGAVLSRAGVRVVSDMGGQAHAGKPKITQLSTAACVQQHVGWLQICATANEINM